jgi:hypothetical protein
MKLSNRHVALILAVIMVLVGVSWVYAQNGPVASGVIHACVNDGSGTIKIVAEDKECNEGWTALHWNAEGPPGPPGGDNRPSLYNHLCNAILYPEAAPLDVMTLEVPAGSWLANISIQAGGLGPCGGGHPDEGKSLSGNYDCKLMGGVTSSGGHPASSRVGEFNTLAWSEPLILEQDSTVTVSCDLFDGSWDGATLSVGDFTVTPVNPWESHP